ncbi:MAG: O-antigen ligase [Pseudomonadota bacterium]
MSSIGTLETDLSEHRSRQFVTLWRTLLVTAALITIWLSFVPFNGDQPVQSRGTLINQVGYTTIAALLLATLMMFVSSAAVTRLLSASWLLLMGWILISGMVVSPLGDDGVRGAIFSLVVTVLAACIVAAAPDERSFVKALTVAVALILGLCYAGLVLLPEAAIHTTNDIEPQHVGLWRGVYFHKNMAGPVMAMLLFASLYIARRGSTGVGLLLAFAALFFLYQTGSKTSFALAPVVIAIVFIPASLGLRFLVPFLALVAIAGAHALTIGTVYFDQLDGIVKLLSPDTTFTGRTQIWTFAQPYTMEHPLTGFGYGGFWRTETATGAEQPFDTFWDPRGIIHGHNGYLDAILNFGVPGFALMIWVTICAPALHFWVAPRTHANDAATEFFYMVIVFAALNASLESFFFNRADPVWITAVFALFGLRLASRFPITR